MAPMIRAVATGMALGGRSVQNMGVATFFSLTSILSLVTVTQNTQAQGFVFLGLKGR